MSHESQRRSQTRVDKLHQKHTRLQLTSYAQITISITSSALYRGSVILRQQQAAKDPLVEVITFSRVIFLTSL